MKQARIKRFAQRWLLPRLGGWTISKTTLARRHTESLLLLIDFESSSFHKDIWSHVVAVVFPLYLGYEYLVLNIGRELYRLGRETWELCEGDVLNEQVIAEEVIRAIEQEGWPFLRSLATLDRLVVELPKAAADRGHANDFELEALAGAELLLGRPFKSLDYIAAMTDLLLTDDRDWAVAKCEEWRRFAKLIKEDEGAARLELNRRIKVAEQQFGAPPVTPIPN